MKGKRINPIERHGEKLFFLLTLAVLLVVLVKQFATGGMSVKVGPKDGLSIGQGYDEIAVRAERLEGQIKSNELDAKAPTEAPSVIELVQAAIPGAQPIALAPIPLGLPDSPGGSGGAYNDSTTVGQDVRYAMPAPTAPATPLVKRYAGAIDPATVSTTPGLGSYVGAVQPFDLHAITVATKFDASALRDSFSRDPDGDGPILPIPGHWWRGQLILLDVEIWRQEIYPGGENGPETLIDPLPGVVSVRAQLEDPDMPMPEILKAAEDAPREIARPDFYPVIAGEVWSPPAPPIVYSKAEAEAIRRRAEIARIDEEITTHEQDLDELQQSGRPNQRSQRGARESGFGDTVAGVGGGRGGGRGRTRPSGRNDAAANAAKRAREAKERREKMIEGQIDDLKSERQEHVAWLTEQGFKVDDDHQDDPGLDLVKETPGTLKESDAINVWGSDISVEPGATYRYRIRLVYGNPFFGRENVINADQRAALSGPRVIRSGFSPWSDAVTMDESNYYYLTRVSGQSSALGGAPSRVVYAEVYTFFYGFWRKADVRLRPGDPIVGEFELPALETFEFALDGDGRFNPKSLAKIPVDSTLEKFLSSILLDVRPSARVQRDSLKGGRAGDPVYEAVLLDESGRLAVRDPSMDRANERRKHMKTSAEQGETAVVVEPGLGGVASVESRSEDDRFDERDERGAGPGGGRGGRGGIGG